MPWTRVPHPAFMITARLSVPQAVDCVASVCETSVHTMRYCLTMARSNRCPEDDQQRRLQNPVKQSTGAVFPTDATRREGDMPILHGSHPRTAASAPTTQITAENGQATAGLHVLSNKPAKRNQPPSRSSLCGKSSRSARPNTCKKRSVVQ